MGPIAAGLALLLAAGGCGGSGEQTAPSELDRTRQLYLDLLKLTLTDLIYENHPKIRARLACDASFFRDTLRGEKYDYNVIPACRKAVNDYRAEHGIDAPLQKIDWNAVYWQKP